jgi:hypothetical protein
MVAITRSASARQQRSSNENNVIPSAGVKKVSRKKKTITKKEASSPDKCSSVLTTTTTPNVLGMFTFLRSQTLNPTMYLDEMPLTTPTASSVLESSQYENNCDDNSIIIDNNVEQSADLPPASIDSNNSINSNIDLCSMDDDNQLDTVTSWPAEIGEIEWCKTSRGNDRICMCGFTYDFMSESAKKNQRNFRCSKKGIGCRVVVYVSMDANSYKGFNHVEHNHPPNHHHTKRLLILQQVKNRVLVEPTPVTRIIEDEYSKNNLNKGDRCHFLLPQAQGKKNFYDSISYEI